MITGNIIYITGFYSDYLEPVCRTMGSAPCARSHTGAGYATRHTRPGAAKWSFEMIVFQSFTL